MLGIDIEKTVRFIDWDVDKLSRIFTENEIAYAQKQINKNEHLCGFYCVKEAFVKAADNKRIAYKKIEVLHTESGKPYINLNKDISSILKKQNCKNIQISISHTESYAVAVVQIN